MGRKTRKSLMTIFVSLIAALSLGLTGCDGSGFGGCSSGDQGAQTDMNTSTSTSTGTSTQTGESTDIDTQGQVEPPSPVVNGTSGYATRYWDCCKPHCGWKANVPAGVNPVGTCNINNEPNGISDMIKSSCNEGGEGYTCWNMAPYAVSDKLAYGYAAVSAAGDICGKCYQLDFKGTGFHSVDDPGSKALKGKTMIVQATNIGYDVGHGQIDLMVPGGGVGAFDACTKQWGASAEQMGVQYGGFLMACKQELGWNVGLDAYKSCVMQRCDNLFSKPGMEDLLDGCRWFVDWFEAADNPTLEFKEVECPDALNNLSGMLP